MISTKPQPVADDVTEAEELGAGALDVMRGFYPVANDMPPAYHLGARMAQRYLVLSRLWDTND